MMIDEPPFSANLTTQLAALQRKEMAEAILKMSEEVTHISNTLARQDERLLATGVVIAAMGKDLAEVKALVNRYKGGIAVILGISGVLVSVVALWDTIVKRFH